MIYGYARVSTKEQNEQRQLVALRERGVKDKNVFVDKQSGKDFEREKYKKLLRKIKKNDVIVIKSIDRLGRNYKEIIEQWRIITQVKLADIIVIDMPLLDTTKNKDLMGTFVADLVLQVLSFVSETERKNIRQRQAEGIAIAKSKGIRFGRQRKYDPDDYLHIYKKVKNGEMMTKDAIALMGVSERTYRRMKPEWEKKLLADK